MNLYAAEALVRKCLPVQIRQVLISHGVVRVRHLVARPDEGAVAHRRTLLDPEV